MEEFCFGCEVSLEGRKGDRRLIGSASTQHIIPLLCDVAVHTGTDLGLYVQLNEETMAGYICRPCFRSFEKLQKLQEQLKSLHEHLYTNAKNAVPYLPILPHSSQSVSQTEVQDAQRLGSSSESEEYQSPTSELVQKRSLCSPKRVKRRRLELKKIRQTPFATSNTSFPPIAVSSLIELCFNLLHE